MTSASQPKQILLLVSILLCLLAFEVAQAQSVGTSELDLYVDSVYGSDFFPGTYSFPIRTLDYALSWAEKTTYRNLILRLFPRNRQYTFYDTVVNRTTLQSINIQSVEESSTSGTDVATIIVSGNVQFNNLSTLIFEQVLIGNDNQTNSSKISVYGSNLTVSNSMILLTSQAQQFNPMNYSRLFDIDQSSVIMQDTTFNFPSDAGIMQATFANVTFQNITMNCGLSSDLSFYSFLFDQSNLMIDTMVFNGISMDPPTELIRVRESFDAAVIHLMVSSLRIKDILYIPGKSFPVELISGQNVIPVDIENFTAKDSVLKTNILSFGGIGSSAMRINIRGLYIQGCWSYLDQKSHSESRGLIYLWATWDLFGPLTIHIEDVVIQDNTQIMQIDALHKPFNIFYLEGNRRQHISMSNVVMHNNTIKHTLLALHSNVIKFLLQNLTISNNTFHAPLLNLQPMNSNAMDIVNLNILNNSFPNTSLIILSGNETEPRMNTKGVDTNYVKVTNMSLKSNMFEQQGRLGNEITSLIICFDFGIRIFNSVISDNTLVDTRLLEIANTMVTVVILNSYFSNLSSHSSTSSSLFYKRQMDYSQNYIIDQDNNRLVPDFGSFCLLNNTFEGSFILMDRELSSILNVANFFIHGNSFINVHFDTHVLFGVTDIVPFEPRNYPMKILLSEDLQHIIDQNLTDPFLLDLFERAIFSDPNGVAPVENISSVFSLRDNLFQESYLKMNSLLQISSIIPDALIDISKNRFLRINGTYASHYNEVVYLFELQVTSNLYFGLNTLSNINMSVTFLKISESIDNSTTLFIQKNILTNSSNSTLLEVDTHSPIAIQINDNFVSSCVLEQAPLIHFNFREGASSVSFSGNTFKEITIFAEGFSQIGLIVLGTQNNVPVQIIFERNWVVENKLQTRGLNPSVLDSKNAIIYLMSISSEISIKNSTFISNRAGSNTYFLVMFSTAIHIDGLVFKDQRGIDMGTPKSSIYAAARNFTLLSSIFEGNSAQAGGCVSLDYLISGDHTDMRLYINNNSFTNNGASQGGVLFIRSLKAYVLEGLITQNVFQSNLAATGSSIYMEDIYLSQFVIENNTFNCDFPDYMNSFIVGGIISLQKIKIRKDSVADALQFANSAVTIRNNVTLIQSMIDIFATSKITLKNLTFISERNFSTSTTLISIDSSRAQLISVNASGFSSQYHLIYIKNTADVSVESSYFLSNYIATKSCIFQVEGFRSVLLMNNSIIRGSVTTVWNPGTYGPSPICISSDSANLVLNNSDFTQNRVPNGGVVSAYMLPLQFENSTFDGKIIIQNCNFEGNEAVVQGGAILQAGGSLEITNSRFIDNTAHLSGGAIFLTNFVSVNITKTLFLRNSVNYTDIPTLYAGAIYLALTQTGALLVYPDVLIESNTFLNNRVDNGRKGVIGGGGAVFVQFVDDISLNATLIRALWALANSNYYQGNLADYGADYSTNPYSSSFRALNSSTNATYECYGTPCRLNTTIRGDAFHGYYLHIVFYDLFNQPLDVKHDVNIPSNFKMNLKITNQSQIYSDSNCSTGHCVINGNDASIRGFANQDINLTFDVISPSLYLISFVLTTSIRPCRMGEINDTKQLMCTPCRKGTYSLSPSDKACQTCPQNANCSEGLIVVREGFWRPSNATAHIYPCNNTKVCNQELYGDSICAPGYKGPYCLACDLENGYAASGDKCGKCPSLTQGLIIFCSIHLAIFFIEIGYVWYFRKINKSLIVDDKYSQRSVARVSRGGYLTIILDYLQILTILKGYPLLVSGFLIGLAHVFSPSQAILFSSDCVFLQLGMSLNNLYYSKMVMLVALPYFKWFLFLTFGFVKKFIYSSYRYRTFIIVATQCMIQIEQPSMLYTLSSYLVCKSSDPLATDQSQVAHYMKDAPYVTCYTDIYYGYRRSLIIPMLLFWGVFLPLCLLTILIWNRKGLKTKAFSMKFGHQYAIYRSKCYYWNLVQFSQKFVLICFAQFSFLPLKTLGLTLFLILILFVILIKTFKPYRSIDLYSTEILSSYLFILTIFLAVYGYQEDALNEVISYVIIILNVTFILYIIIKVLHLMGFRWITRCLSVLLSKCFNRRKNSNFFFNENYHQRAESMLHPDDVSFVKRDSRLHSRRDEITSRFYKASEMPTQDISNFQQSLLSSNSQIISAARITENVNTGIQKVDLGS